MSKFIGIDIGSSSIKGAVLDLERCAVGATARLPSPRPVEGLPANYFEVDPLLVVDAVRDVLGKLLVDVDHCAGIVSCSQMAGVVLSDPSGSPLTNYLSWQDQRAADPHPSGPGTYYDVLEHRLGAQALSQLGRECKLGSCFSLLFWLAERGELPGDAIPLGLGDFLWTRLCRAEPVTDYTHALGAMNLESWQWHQSAMKKLGIDHLRWPRLCDAHQAIAKLTIDGRTMLCFPSVGDHQCALAGTLLAERELSINVSTGSQVSLLAGDYRPGPYQVRPYFAGQYLNTLTHLPAGRSLNAIVDLLGELARSQGQQLDNPWPFIMQAAAAAAPDPALAAELTFFAGPLGERGSISNITTGNLTIGALFRAAFQNMADNYEACARRVAPGNDWQRIVLSGGLVQHGGVLREMICQKFDRPIRVCPVEEETFTGLLVLALVASGRASDVVEASRLVASQACG